MYQQQRQLGKRTTSKLKYGYLFQMLSQNSGTYEAREVFMRGSLKDIQRFNIRETKIILNLRALSLNKKKNLICLYQFKKKIWESQRFTFWEKHKDFLRSGKKKELRCQLK